MQEFPKVDEGAKLLYDMAYAPMYTRTLFAGIVLGVFSELEEPKKHTEVAEKLDLHWDNTKYLLNALTSLNLLEKSRGKYKNTELSSKYLVKSSNLYIGDFLMQYCSVSGFDDIDIVKQVKEGPNSGYEDKKGLEAHEIYGDYAQMIKTSQKVGRAHEITEIVSSLPEFDGFKKMLDLGAGPGLIGIAIVKKHPLMKGVIFDTPDVAKVAQESIKEYNLEDRVEVMAGDYMVDSIGEGYDFILASDALAFAKYDLDATIKKIYDALNPKGVFMCICEGLTNEKTKPKEVVIGWLPAFLKGVSDFSFEQGEISDAVLKAGFRSVYKRTVPGLTGDMDFDIARK